MDKQKFIDSRQGLVQAYINIAALMSSVENADSSVYVELRKAYDDATSAMEHLNRLVEVVFRDA